VPVRTWRLPGGSITAHGGRVSVESSVEHADHGTKITLAIPAR
jgi:hypothetical protein